MNGVPLGAYIGLGMFMFTTGVVGVIIRRNPIVIFMCIELMLNSVNLTFLTFARYQLATNPDNRVAMQNSMAAAEVAVGLGIIMAIYRLRDSVDIDELNLLRG